MWLANIENSEAIKAIYRNKIPSINQVLLRDICISTGEDLALILVFDIEDLPDDMPSKWKTGNVNTIQIDLNCIGVEIKYLGLNNKNYRNLSIDISLLENDSKRIIGTDNSGICVFEIEAIWIYLKTITGYNDEKVTHGV
ncbi:MAG TPA: Imm50 family immunity protein [Saprospiraceae bacterium]|nr:Imm50 family immunity protein [Saprospiraceae bacterium]